MLSKLHPKQNQVSRKDSFFPRCSYAVSFQVKLHNEQILQLKFKHNLPSQRESNCSSIPYSIPYTPRGEQDLPRVFLLKNSADTKSRFINIFLNP